MVLRGGLAPTRLICHEAPALEPGAIFGGRQSLLARPASRRMWMGTGTYEEPLSCGGTLKVCETSWQISYYFSGPDMRYNGTFLSVPGFRIDQYISAFNENWAEYEQLKSAIPKGGGFSKPGKMGMQIHIGNSGEGVCIESYHMPIRSKQQLEKVINDYRYATQRAPQIQELLASL